jgi:CheY-like chemotaxis protein
VNHLMIEGCPILILVVEEGTRIRRALSSASETLQRPVLASVSSAADALVLLRQWKPTLVIADGDKPETFTAELRKVVHRCLPPVPLIAVTRSRRAGEEELRIPEMLELLALKFRRSE